MKESIDPYLNPPASEELRAREETWAAESERRIDAFEAGKVAARDAQEVLRDLWKGLR